MLNMNNISIKGITLICFSFFYILLFTGCIHKNIDGSNNFDSLISNLVDNSSDKLKKNISRDDTVLVSDFVNLDKLQNHSKLGFLLSDTLKNSLSSEDIIIREVELGKDFTLGKHGFNVLTREKKRINSEVIHAQYAVVGTYSITTKRLIVFIKLIDINTGHILSSSSDSVMIDKEIRELEATEIKRRRVYNPLVL